jgi:hypothetical protein
MAYMPLTLEDLAIALRMEGLSVPSELLPDIWAYIRVKDGVTWENVRGYAESLVRG